jgi:uncharacterized membrane protein HdeD (DUF308 family)
LFVVGGVAAIKNPLAASASLTLLIGFVLLAAGTMRVFDALLNRYGQWGWRLFHGLVTAVLGGMIVSQWPVSALWFLGLAMSIELLLHGWHAIVLALVARKYLHDHPVQPATHRPAPATM